MKETKDNPEPLPKFLTDKSVREIASRYGTPVYVYSQKVLEEQADKALDFPNEFGLTVRYAMKANPSRAILRTFDKKGIKIDASSGFEARRAIMAGIHPDDILITSQQIPDDLKELVERGVNYNACSLGQLQTYGKLFPQTLVSIRVNPGLGSGGTKRTNTGGPASSFGIWHEQIPEAMKIVQKYGLSVERLHTHIGSGSDPEVWKKVSHMSLDIALELVQKYKQDLFVLNLGGGYKVGRMGYEQTIDLQECGEHVKKAIMRFYSATQGRRLKLEIEPGTFLVANAGAVIAKVNEIKKTPLYNFIMTDTGMTEVTRPSLYGAQHPITVVPNSPIGRRKDTDIYIVSGHCCESGDILNPAKGDPEALQPRRLLRAIAGDFVVVGGAGAYCAGMSTKNYNSYPEAPEVMIDLKDHHDLIRRRQTLEQMTQNEI